MKLSTYQLELLRNNKPHRTKLYASIFKPKTIMKCRINDSSISRNSRTITYDSVTYGSYTNVKSGMTLLIGSADGMRDYGKIRIRSVTSTEFVVSENSNIDWEDNLYLTVIGFYDIWPVFPRIIQNPSNDEDVIFYKDYDVEYDNQNSVLGTFVNMGPHRATFLVSGTGVDVYYSATGSYNVAGAGKSYYWSFEGGTPSTSTLETPGYVHYDTPGHYITSLSVSGTNGGGDISNRYISIYDRPEDGPNFPYRKVEITDISQTRGEGGASASIKIYDALSDDIQDGAVVVIFKEDWYGEIKTSIGGNSPNASDIFMVGYILSDTIRWNYVEGLVEFRIGNISEYMKRQVGFAVSVESKAAPNTWFEVYDMNAKKAIYHYLKWHTTVLSSVDFQFIGQDYPIQYFDSDRESMFDAIDNLMRGSYEGQITSDMQNKLWAEINAEAVTNPYAVYPTNPIINSDWMGQPYIEEQPLESVSYLERGGIAYSGALSGTYSALMSCAPGDAPGFRGNLDRRQGLALQDQDQLNWLTGNLYANRNARYKTLNLSMAGNYSNMDVAPQNLYYTVINASDTPRGIALTAYYVPESIFWTYNAEQEFLSPQVSFKQVVINTIQGQTIPIPDVPEDDGYGNKRGKIKIPPIIPPTMATTQVVKLYGLGQIAAGQSGVIKWTGIQLSIPAAYTDSSGTMYAGSVIQWPSSVHAGADADGYIDVLQAGIFRIIAPIVAGVPLFLPTSLETILTYWGADMGLGNDYPGSSTYPYKTVLKSTYSPGNVPYVMADTCFMLPGKSISINLVAGATYAAKYFAAITIEYIPLTG